MDATALGGRVRRIRRAQGMSMESLAREADVSTGTVYRLETGRIGEPAASTVHAIARVLGVSVDSLLSSDEPGLIFGAAE